MGKLHWIWDLLLFGLTFYWLNNRACFHTWKLAWHAPVIRISPLNHLTGSDVPLDRGLEKTIISRSLLPPLPSLPLSSLTSLLLIPQFWSCWSIDFRPEHLFLGILNKFSFSETFLTKQMNNLIIRYQESCFVRAKQFPSEGNCQLNMSDIYHYKFLLR